jgi:hypothetical protein
MRHFYTINFIFFVTILNVTSKISQRYLNVHCTSSLKTISDPFCYLKSFDKRKRVTFNIGFTLKRKTPTASVKISHVWKLIFLKTNSLRFLYAATTNQMSQLFTRRFSATIISNFAKFCWSQKMLIYFHFKSSIITRNFTGAFECCAPPKVRLRSTIFHRLMKSFWFCGRKVSINPTFWCTIQKIIKFLISLLSQC